MRATRTLTTILAAAVALALPLAAPAAAAPPDPHDALQVFNRDVYELVGASLRNPTADTDPGATLYSDVGAALPVTWGEWSAASATSTVRTIGGPGGPRTDVRMALTGLVPGGLYSVFWGTFGPDSEHPGCPGVERTLPLDAFPADAGQPAPNAFVAGADGTAEFRGRAEGSLLDATQVFLSVNYHFFPETSYPFPNRGELLTQGEDCRSSYGHDVMRHLLILQKW
jgi:hypothetical protein